ncbi:odorant-binding protein 2b [Octodon degus]|uniref:Odorant-binding protein 2b n=1 Tax=Octodon degus TaxID=10160 RepID=A0A6P6D8N5_OCTDE|nr:odorant-binding protein 2b [Octodon degus]
MKTLLLTLVLLGLVAALQAQDPLSLQPEEPDVRLGGGGNWDGLGALCKVQQMWPLLGQAWSGNSLAGSRAARGLIGLHGTHTYLLQLTGTWYTKALVSNMTLPEGKKLKVVFPLTVTARGGGDLEARVTFLIKGQCHVKEIPMQKTEEPGKYSAFGGKKFIYVEELPVQDHYIFYCEKRGPGKTFGMGKLMGRTPEENPKALEEFRKFAQRKQLSQEKIIIPEQRESCVPDHD